MRMSLHVLLATDGSDASISAATRGRDLLAGIERITLLTVVSDDDPGDDAGGIEGPVLTQSEQEELKRQQAIEARDELARTAAMLTGVPVEQLIEEGDPADTICRVAERLGVGAIVVGSHGRTGLRRLFLGSVSEHVVRHAPCPVLVVRARPNRAIDAPPAAAGTASPARGRPLLSGRGRRIGARRPRPRSRLSRSRSPAAGQSVEV